METSDKKTNDPYPAQAGGGTGKTKNLQVRLPENVYNALLEQADARCLAISTYARQILTGHVLGRKIPD